MTLLADLSDPSKFLSRIGQACSVCDFIDTLTDEERTAFVALLAQPSAKVPGAAIERVLAANGHTLKAGNINRHRRNECRAAR